jgi:MFS family permease
MIPPSRQPADPRAHPADETQPGALVGELGTSPSGLDDKLQAAEGELLPVHPRAAFQHRDFRLYMGVRVLVTLALQVQLVAVGWHIYEQTHRARDLGYVGLAQFLPAIGFSIVTGHVADRFDRRRVLLACYLGLALCSVALAVLAGQAGQLDVRAIYAVLFLVGTARAFGGPAAQALMPGLVPREHFANAVAWSSSLWQLTTIVGPAVGGVVAAAFTEASSAYALCAALLLAACCLCAAMRPPVSRREHRAASWSTLVAGVRYVAAHKVVLGAISLDLFAVLLGGAVALMPVFARDILHVGPVGLGVLRAAPAVGAASVAVALAYRPLRRRAGATMLACVAIFGLATIVFGLSRSAPLSLCCLLVIGASDMVSVAVRQTLVQLWTPDEMRGRVSAVNLVFVGASNELGEFESGLTADYLGAVRAVVLGGVGTCLVVLIWAMAFRDLRRVDRLEAPR